MPHQRVAAVKFLNAVFRLNYWNAQKILIYASVHNFEDVLNSKLYVDFIAKRTFQGKMSDGLKIIL